MSYPGPPPEYDRTQLQAANEAFRAPSYSPERQQHASRFGFAQGKDDEEDFFLSSQGFGASQREPAQRGDRGMQNGNGFPPGPGNPQAGYNSGMQPGNQAAQQAHQQALLRAAYEADKRMGNAGAPDGHFNHQQMQQGHSTEVYYDMDRQMSPQSSPGNSMSPQRNQRKGSGKGKNQGNQFPQDFNAQAQNWQKQQMEMGYGALNHQARGKGQGGRGQAKRGKGSAEQM